MGLRSASVNKPVLRSIDLLDLFGCFRSRKHSTCILHALMCIVMLPYLLEMQAIIERYTHFKGLYGLQFISVKRP